MLQYPVSTALSVVKVNDCSYVKLANESRHLLTTGNFFTFCFNLNFNFKPKHGLKLNE